MVLVPGEKLVRKPVLNIQTIFSVFVQNRPNEGERHDEISFGSAPKPWPLLALPISSSDTELSC